MPRGPKGVKPPSRASFVGVVCAHDDPRLGTVFERRFMNDDKSPLLGLLNCIVCKITMKLERIDPDDEGKEIILYRCELCGRIERLRLRRGSRV